MSVAADKAIQRWADRVCGYTTQKQLQASNILASGDKVYSYGTHFELARALRDKKGELQAFLLNGDRYSQTTTGHQTAVRWALARRTNVERVIIPHSALEAAGIDLNSIRILQVTPDRNETKHHRTTEMPEGARWRTRDVMDFVPMTPEEIQEWLDDKNRRKQNEWEYSVERHRRNPQLWKHPGKFVPVTEDDMPVKTKYVKVGETRHLHTSSRKFSPEITITEQEDGSKVYEWETRHHWLGESLIRARVNWLGSETCPRCEGTGTLIGPTIHGGNDCRRCWGAGTVQKQCHRWATFLSGFDHAESRPLYFFCELPYRSGATTVAEAYEALKPDPVKLAEQMGRSVTRQGDIFGVPTTLDRKALLARGARIEKRNMSTDIRIKADIHLPYILGTNHTASEVAYLPGGLTLARGILYHDPQWRRADHARRKLGDGKTWHIVVKNTVPTTGRR